MRSHPPTLSTFTPSPLCSLINSINKQFAQRRGQISGHCLASNSIGATLRQLQQHIFGEKKKRHEATQ